jgi:hypothetical protein
LNRKSPSSSEVNIAAMSPARSSVGPLVGRRPTPISSARMRQRVVLPSPGGPSSSIWSRGSPRCLAACTKILRFCLSASCPTNSSNELGLSVGSSSPTWASGSSGCSPNSPKPAAPVMSSYGSSSRLSSLMVKSSIFRAQRLLPIRRNASFMYFSTESCGGTSLSAFSASSSLYPSAVRASLASM